MECRSLGGCAYLVGLGEGIVLLAAEGIRGRLAITVGQLVAVAVEVEAAVHGHTAMGAGLYIRKDTRGWSSHLHTSERMKACDRGTQMAGVLTIAQP
jgi:hypothetical protein